MTKGQIERLIDDRIENRFRTRMISQNDILPQTIKERHIDWEEFGVTLNSSIIQKISELIFVSSTGTGSATIADDTEESVTITVSDSGSSTSRIIFAIIHVSAYETSVAAANQIPWGTNLLFNDYIRYTAHDWGTNNNLYSTLVDMVRNESGGSQSVLWRANARYIGQSAI